MNTTLDVYPEVSEVLQRLLAKRAADAPEAVSETAQPAVPKARTARSARRDWKSLPATDQQKNYIRTLLAQRDEALVASIRATLNRAREDGSLTRGLASGAIDALLAIPRSESTPAATEAVEARPVLQPGIYTLDKGAAGHRTFKVIYLPTDSDFAPGRTVLAYLSGRDNEEDYYSFGFVNQTAQGLQIQPWKKHTSNIELLSDAAAFLSNPEAALESAQCFRCGRALTTPESLAAGIGPVCARKGY